MKQGKRIEIAEHVLPGHPDKLCDAAVDAIVDFVRRRDPRGQCGLEAACVFDTIHLTGRVAAKREVLEDLRRVFDDLVRGAYRSAGYGVDAAGHLWGPDPEALQVTRNLCYGPFEEGEREFRGLSDDQAVCVGYANADPATDHLPPAHWLARRIARNLHRLGKEKGAGHVGPDGKVIVRVEVGGDVWVPLHVSISLNHHEASDWLLLRAVAEEAVATACAGIPVPPLKLNGAGMFVSGGPNGDNGLTGKKLVVDAYGPTVPIGGGAWSGKDFNKVDRLGGLLARQLALACVRAGLAREAQVTLEYIPGGARPEHVAVVLDGKSAAGDPLKLVGEPEVGNSAVTARFVDADAALEDLARWGHQQPGLPWEAEV